MILEEFGILCDAQDLTAEAADSENVILLPSVKDLGFGDLWLTITTETIATGDSADTFQFQFVLSEESTLDTNIEIFSRTITGYASEELATLGRNIVALNVGQMIGELQEAITDLYLGLVITVSAGATLSVDASLSPSKPRTKDNVQVVRSNVGVPT